MGQVVKYAWGAAVISLALTGCSEGSPSAEEIKEEKYCGEEWCTFGEIEGAYAVGTHSSLFCYAEKARELVDSGDVDLTQLIEELPDWAVAEDENGDPVIIEVATTHPEVARDRAREVDEALESQGVHLDRNETRDCMDEVDQQMIEDSEGPYRGPV